MNQKKSLCCRIVFALFYLVYEGNFKFKPLGVSIQRSDLKESFLHYDFGELMLQERLIFRIFTVLQDKFLVSKALG